MLRQRHFQQTDDTVRPAGTRSNHGRQKEHVTFPENIISTGVLQMTTPGEADQYPRKMCRAHDKRQSPGDSYDTEVLAMNQRSEEHTSELQSPC